MFPAWQSRRGQAGDIRVH